MNSNVYKMFFLAAGMSLVVGCGGIEADATDLNDEGSPVEEYLETGEGSDLETAEQGVWGCSTYSFYAGCKIGNIYALLAHQRCMNRGKTLLYGSLNLLGSCGYKMNTGVRYTCCYPGEDPR